MFGAGRTKSQQHTTTKMKTYTRPCRRSIVKSSLTTGLCFVSIVLVNAAVDPGPRTGTADAGTQLPGLSTSESNAFVIAQTTFNEVDSVNGTIAGEADSGLGPRFNMNSCAGCHAFPASGGTSPQSNPQTTVATLHGAHNIVPSFITANGPVREARFIKNPDGTPDGGVHALFVITGRSDAPAGFNLPQTDFASQVAANNVIFRIPTPTFGTGLIESITEQTILNNQAANASVKAQLGISGHPNRSGNDGTITRFGWKAQNKSLLMFSGEAYNVEQGVTNDLFPNARELGNQTLPAGQPESTVDLATGGIGDIEQFMIFMRLLDAPKRRNPPGVSNASIAAGNTNFNNVGCIQCHTPSLTTGPSPVAALSNKTVPLYSDLLVHHMGWRLADNVSQGGAAGDEFRSAPLWGLGQRIFLLHDGRMTDLEQAIRAHASEALGTTVASEANTVVQNFINLSDAQKQDMFNFLRSL